MKEKTNEIHDRVKIINKDNSNFLVIRLQWGEKKDYDFFELCNKI